MILTLLCVNQLPNLLLFMTDVKTLEAGLSVPHHRLNTRHATQGGQKIDFGEDNKQNRLLQKRSTDYGSGK